jgi:hypothetical protein
LCARLDPLGAVMWRALAFPAAALAIAHWVRRTFSRTPPPDPGPEDAGGNDEPAAPQAQDATPAANCADDLADRAITWAKRIAAPGGTLTDSLLTDLTVILDHGRQPNGFEAAIRLNQGDGPVRHQLSHAIAATPLIAAAYDTIPGNIVVESLKGARTVNAARLRVFDRNPLERVIAWTGTTPGSWRYPLAVTTGGDVITDEVRVDGRPGHRLVVGTTGSGKSATMRLLIEARLRITDEAGHPMVRVVLCDPHKGASYGPKHGNQRERVADFVTTKETIYEAVTWMAAELDRRLDYAAEVGQDPLEVTAELPHLVLALDEWPKLWKADSRLMEPVVRLLREMRKVSMSMIISSQGALLEDLGDAAVRDGLLSGGAILLRSMNSYTQLVTGLGRQNVGDPTLLPLEWPDGSSAGGTGFLLDGGVDASTMIRMMNLDPAWMAANPAPDVPKGLCDVGGAPVGNAMPQYADTTPPAGERPDTPAERDAELVIAYLEELGEPASSEQIHQAIGRDAETALNALVAASGRRGVQLLSGGLLDGRWAYTAPDDEPADAAPTVDQDGDTRDRIMAVLRSAGRPMALAGICEQANCKGPNANQILTRAAKRGLAVKAERGFWSLPEFAHLSAAEPALA